MNGEDPTFDYVLAEKLNKSVAEIHALDNSEYVGWAQYCEVKSVLQELAERSAVNRGNSRPHKD